MIRDKTGFLEFLAESDDIMRSLESGHYASLDHLKRLVHTLKGNSAIFGMRRVSEICHEVENEIAEQGETPAGMEMAALNQAWGQIYRFIEKLIVAKLLERHANRRGRLRSNSQPCGTVSMPLSRPE